MAVFGLKLGAGSYPGSGDLRFGDEYGNADYVVPMARFEFYDPFGNPASGAPVIYIKMTSGFSSQLNNRFNDATGIFGTPGGGDESFFENLGIYGDSFVTALQKQILTGLTGAAGFAASAGSSGANQVEFLQRKLINNFQQLIYQGPTFRIFNIPFNMRPTSPEEAEAMRDIIATFKYASSPIADEDVSLRTDDGVDPNALDQQTLQSAITKSQKGEALTAEENEVLQKYVAATQGNPLANENFNLQGFVDTVSESGSTFTFAYPDMCRFQLILVKPTGDFVQVFESDFCMIENVAVEYGAQNKMTFFQQSGGLHYPTDVTMTLALKEANLQTAASIREKYDNNNTII